MSVNKMLSFNQLFYYNNSTFDRLPLWKKESKLINILTEEEDLDDNWWESLNPEICSKINLNVIWSLMTDFNFNTKFKNDPFISDYNNFEQLYACADYLQIDKVCKKMARLYLDNGYWGKLINAPQTMINFIKISKELLELWGEIFICDEIFNFWKGLTHEFNPRSWNPDLFYNTTPSSLSIDSDTDSDSDDEFGNLFESWKGRDDFKNGRIMTNITWWHHFWDCLTESDWNEERWQVMLPFLIETNIFGLLTIFPLPNHLCPVWSSTMGTFTSYSTTAAQITRPEWVNMLFTISPHYFTVEGCQKNVRKRSNYPLIVQFIQTGMINYAEDMLDILPRDWGTAHGTCIMNLVTDVSSYGPEVIHRIYEKGFKPNWYIFKILYDKATMYRRFLTGWSYLLGLDDPAMPIMKPNTLNRWVHYIMDSPKNKTTNERRIIDQMKDICSGQIMKRVGNRQNRLNILSFGMQGWSMENLIPIEDKEKLINIHGHNLEDRLYLVKMGFDAEFAHSVTNVTWCDIALDEIVKVCF